MLLDRTLVLTQTTGFSGRKSTRLVKNESQKANTTKKRVQKPKAETQGFPTVPIPLANSLATQRTVDLKFVFWIFSGFTWFATQLTHIHRFMYCGMLSKLTKLSKAIKHRFWFTCWFSKPSFSLLRRSFQVGLVPLESSVSPVLFFALVSEQCTLFGCSFLPNAWTFLLKNTNFGVFGIRNFWIFGELILGFRLHVAEKSRYL